MAVMATPVVHALAVGGLPAGVVNPRQVRFAKASSHSSTPCCGRAHVAGKPGNNRVTFKMVAMVSPRRGDGGPSGVIAVCSVRARHAQEHCLTTAMQ